MRVLFIGGTGNLSTDCTKRALDLGWEVWHINRGNRQDRSFPEVRTLVADIDDEAKVASLLGDTPFDAVADFIAFRTEQVERDIRLFAGRTAQYVFVSSASAYRKPPVSHIITESTPLENPYWDYARAKIACERRLERERAASGFPYTIVRPSHTYCSRWIPNAWTSSDFTIPARMLAGKEIVVQGDGQSLWTLTHARDFAVGFVGLLGNPAAIGEAVQITGDEALTWDAVHHAIASALGVEAKIVHVPSDFMAKVDPDLAGPFLGDKSCSAIFDCTKLKRLVPEFRTTVPFHRGVRESAEWFLADPARQVINPTVDGNVEKILAAWKRAMAT